MFKGKWTLSKGKRFEYIFLGTGIIVIMALFIVLYQVNRNGRNKAIIVQNSLEGANDQRSDHEGNNNTGSNDTESKDTGSNDSISNDTESNNSESNQQDYNNQENNNTGYIGGSLINLNTASLEDLQTLKGIGPSKAQAIIDYRNKEGEYQHISEITNVSGIGEKTFEKIKEYITVGKE